MITKARRGRIGALAIVAWGSFALTAAMSSAATPTATFLVTFDSTWSAATHPTNFPPGPHFSDLIGATHNAQVSFWQTGSLASAGIEAMSELGSNTPLDDEISAAIVAGDAGEFLLTPGIASPGQQMLVVQASQDHSRLTLVAMIAPSPDWFIGVSGSDLLPGGEWVDELVVDLHAYDAGTDSGVSYTSANSDTDPAENISLLTTSPFDAGVPLGTFTITRLDGPAQAVPSMSGAGTGLLVGVLLVGGLAATRARSLGTKLGPQRTF